MADRTMNSFAPVQDVAYVYAEDIDGNQVKISKANLMEEVGLFKFYGIIKSGESIVLPSNGGIVAVQCASNSHYKACAVMNTDNSGTVLIPEQYIKFFSEIVNKICVLRVSEKWIIKNTFNTNVVVSVFFIG